MAHRSRRRRMVAIGAVIVVVAAIGGIAAFAAAGRDDDGDAERAERDATTTTETADQGEGTGVDGTAAPAWCPPDDRPEATPKRFAEPFPRCIEDGVDYGAVITTSQGAFTVDLTEETAPETVNNFVALSRWGWFDGDDFHRVVPGFVIQGGDPFGEPPGTGGPGYAIEDELPTGVEAYVEGAVAMANSGPNSGGSQFFVCLDCSSLPGPAYSLFGQITAGIEVVEAINALADGDGPPTEGVAIDSVEITEA